MAIFSKRGDVLDITQLQKRGLLKGAPKKIESSDVTQNSSGYVDLASLNKSSVVEKKESEISTQESSSPFAFFDSISQNTNTLDSEIKEPKVQEADNSELLIKLDNLEYQLSNLSEKLSVMEEKIRRFEEKV